MPDIFNISTGNLRELQKFFKKAPKKFEHAAAGLLNTFAFGTRKAAIQKIGKNFIVRNPKFINSKVQVQKAKGSQSIQSQESITGSITAPRFSGLVEQETGQRTKRTRIQTLLARSGSKGNIVKPGFRLKPSSNFLSSDDFKGNSESHRTIVMLNTLKRDNYRKPFVIKKHRKLRTGLYKFIRKKIKMLQDFKPRKVQPKKKPWLVPGRNAFMRKVDMVREWTKQLDRQLKRM